MATVRYSTSEPLIWAFNAAFARQNKSAIVADASVALKWFFRTRADEADVGPALALLAGVAEGRNSLLEPPHVVAEVAAVLARESAQTALTDR